MLLRKIISIALVLIFLGIVPALAYDYCTESGSGWLACEDWETGTPPAANWPYENADTWHSWVPGDSHMSVYNAITSSHSNSGSRSLHIDSRADGGEYPGADIMFNLGSDRHKIYVRFYVYIESLNGSGAHFIFDHGNSYAEASLDIRHWQDQTYSVGGNDQYYFCVHSYSPEVWQAWQSPYSGFNLNSHLDEWILVEWMVDTTNNLTSLWINENPQLINWSMDLNVASDAVWVSGWGLGGGSLYDVDDIVISTSYIGPRGAEEDTTAPTLSNESPSGEQTCSTNPRDVTISVDCSDAVGCTACKADTSDIDIDSMSITLSQSGSTWSGTASSLDCADSYTYYAKCEDAADNESNATEINFSIGTEPETPVFMRCSGHHGNIH